MNKRKTFIKTLFLFLFVMVTNGLAFAQNDGGPGVDNTRDFSFSAFFNNLQGSAQHLQDQITGIFSAQAHAKQVSEDNQENEQASIEKQKMRMQQEQDQVENLKDRMAMQKNNR